MIRSVSPFVLPVCFLLNNALYKEMFMTSTFVSDSSSLTQKEKQQ